MISRLYFITLTFFSSLFANFTPMSRLIIPLNQNDWLKVMGFLLPDFNTKWTKDKAGGLIRSGLTQLSTQKNNNKKTALLLAIFVSLTHTGASLPHRAWLWKCVAKWLSSRVVKLKVWKASLCICMWVLLGTTGCFRWFQTFKNYIWSVPVSFTCNSSPKQPEALRL